MHYTNTESMMSEQYYVLKVNGAAVTPPTTRALVEQKKSELPAQSQALAEVVRVTADGKEILFG